MDVTAVVLITAAMFGWCLLSARLERANLTAPMVFIAVGAALAGLGLVDGPAAPESVTPLLEITLVWVLFSDAARLHVQQLRRDLGRYVRLLGVGLPLTIAFGCQVRMSDGDRNDPAARPRGSIRRVVGVYQGSWTGFSSKRICSCPSSGGSSVRSSRPRPCELPNSHGTF